MRARGGGETPLGASFRQRVILPWWLLLLLAVAAASLAVALRERPEPTLIADPTPTATATPSSTPTSTPAPVATVRVPNTVGSSLARAPPCSRSAISTSEKVKPSGFPESAPVARQDPPAGEKVETQSAVDLVLRAVKVPDLRGLTQAEADYVLEGLPTSGGGVASPWDRRRRRDGRVAYAGSGTARAAGGGRRDHDGRRTRA